MEIDMEQTKQYTGFVHAAGTCSWHVGVTPTEAATKAVNQFKRDFKHIFKIKKGVEYKVSVFDTTNVENWVLDDSGYLHPIGDACDNNVIKDFEIVKVYS
jgi:hypothetical protein